DYVEDLAEDERSDGEIDVAQARREIRDKQCDQRRSDKAKKKREPEVWRREHQQRRRRAIHTEAEKCRVTEGNHACVTDEDVGRHRQQSPDQDFGQEPAPEFRQDQRRDDQQCQHDAECNPIRCVAAFRHFGVGTNSPVGRKSSVRISTMNETITACAGLTQIAAYASSRLMKMAAAVDPPRSPLPSTTTIMKAFNTRASPIV